MRPTVPRPAPVQALVVRIPASLRHALRVAAIRTDVTMQRLVAMAIAERLARVGRRVET